MLVEKISVIIKSVLISIDEIMRTLFPAGAKKLMIFSNYIGCQGMTWLDLR